MNTFRRNVIEPVARLNFPRPERVMITHSSALFARGVDLGRPMGDIDLVTDPDNLLHIARTLGWTATKQIKYYEEDLPEKIRYVRSPDGQYDFFSHDYIPDRFRARGKGRVYPDELFASHDYRFDQDEETGIWVASLEHVEATKRGTGREKDERDIRRLWQYHTDGF